MGSMGRFDEPHGFVRSIGADAVLSEPVEPVPTYNVAMPNYALRARKGRLFCDQPVRLFVDPLT